MGIRNRKTPLSSLHPQPSPLSKRQKFLTREDENTTHREVDEVLCLRFSYSWFPERGRPRDSFDTHQGDDVTTANNPLQITHMGYCASALVFTACLLSLYLQLELLLKAVSFVERVVLVLGL